MEKLQKIKNQNLELPVFGSFSAVSLWVSVSERKLKRSVMIFFLFFWLLILDLILVYFGFGIAPLRFWSVYK